MSEKKYLPISLVEYEGYRAIVENMKETKKIAGDDPNTISKIGALVSVYIARISGPLGDIKDEIDKEFLKLIEKDKTAAVARVEAEVIVNKRHEVTRRQHKYLIDAFDSLKWGAQQRLSSFKKEGYG